jgi:hypothetical protein
VYHQWLRSEHYKLKQIDPRLHSVVSSFLSTPDFNDYEQRFYRRRAIFFLRWPILAQLPQQTEWLLGELDDGDLERLCVIKELNWDRICPDRLLRSVHYPENCEQPTIDKVEGLRSSLSRTEFDKTLILIGVEASSPLTILDGNHRAVAMLIERKDGNFSEAGMSIFVGLSPQMALCRWYSCP